jgi:5-methylcytosine-specific restriction protein A
VLCISGDEGAAFGYADEELDDGTFLYFGEGQEGDMTFDRSNNRAIRDHSAMERSSTFFARCVTGSSST